MEDLEKIKQELQDVTNKQIRLETIVEQAKQRCKEIEDKYNIANETELKQLLDNAETEYQNTLVDAVSYLTNAKIALAPYEGML